MGRVIRREEQIRPLTFTFHDVEQEAADMRRAAEAEARQIVDEARRRTEALTKAHKDRGYEEGLEEGRRAGMELIRKEAMDEVRTEMRTRIDALLAALESGLMAYEQSKRTLLARAETGLIDLANAIARRVCKLQVGDHAETTLANARHLIDLVRHHHDITLLVNPAEFELVRTATEEFIQRIEHCEHVSVVSDESVPRGSCLMRTREGMIDATIETQLQRIAESIGAHPLAPDADAGPREADR